MDLAELIEPDQVVYAARASNKQQLLQDLASRSATLLSLDAQTIFTALQAREELGSTGLGNGFALPHARIEVLNRLFGMFTRLNRPIHFDSIDGNPVDLVFLLLIPPSAGSDHLAALACISRYLRDKEFAARLRKVPSAKRCHTVQSTLRSPAFVIFFERLSYNATPPGQPPNHALDVPEAGAKSSRPRAISIEPSPIMTRRSSSILNTRTPSSIGPMPIVPNMI